MIKCQNHAGLFPWVAVQMVEVIITIHILLCVAVIELFLLTSMYQAAHLLQRLYFMDCFNYRRKSIDARIYLCGGQSKMSIVE
jgi:hypothetical protein